MTTQCKAPDTQDPRLKTLYGERSLPRPLPKGETIDSFDQTISDLGLHPLLCLALQEANLSPREALTLALSLRGFTRREIASQLHLSHTHVMRILKKISEKVVPKLPFPPIYI